jgi:alkanesulfonate monooxygenase SsuD/methylene tetrahydromethanopterin reductase-like flavin-dependent oxidoreductase (luciferase family)
VRLQPAPERGKIPIWIGGNSRAALRRAARFDGWAADTCEIEKMTLSPDDLAKKVDELRVLRAGSDAPFDVAVFGYSEPGDDSLPAAYAAAGATWWLEYFHDRRGPLELTRRRIEAGPN